MENAKKGGIWLPRHTLTLISVTIAAYFALSGGLPYIPDGLVNAFGFSLYSPLGLITYPFVHVSLSHLVGNMLFLLVVGAFAERKLRPVDFYSVYFLSAAYSALAFGLLEPNTVLVGASAAVAGLMVAAFLADLRRAVVAVLFTMLLAGYLIMPAFNAFVSNAQDSLAAQSVALSGELDRLNASLSRAQEALASGGISEAEYNRTSAEVSSNSSIVASQLRQVESVLTNVEGGYSRERATRTSILVHLVGGMAALAYVIAFRRDIIWQMRSRR